MGEHKSSRVPKSRALRDGKKINENIKFEREGIEQVS